MRRLVIGDIHGCGKALRTLIESIDPTSDDEIVFLGDYVDRGPNSRDVVDQILELQNRCRVVTLRGNHEIMMLGVLCGGCDPAVWLASGGKSTLASYGGSLSRVPSAHVQFFQQLRPFYETADRIFVHAGYEHDVSPAMTDDAVMYWNHLTNVPPPHHSGKRVYVGHTPQPHGNVLDLGHIICLDTYCFGGGYLTAMDVDTSEIIQADRHGHLRRDRQIVLFEWIKQRWKSYRERRSQRNDEDVLTQPAAQDV
ncbi:metallophosphoesterase family protein [Crateriforma conspicua]|uniref:Serine/threonine-protein phosphatase 1 n=1 Tax=Crateriforma conspicua TaxID=2527996 RepID=A0A5C5Y4H2_9PLAN|nr:metallophosphoesterase family protein [Crateriforma conspicua]QDV64241.1 Bis(5'-nucleosyl)-tetraphosphatase [symmetrical] [Crateriforma conspicua]TWT69633.1 Serine/threonine-protein phosphatase 1 [Crateriforma conspicua]